MDAHHPSDPVTDPTTAFEADLADLVLSAYSCGAVVENTVEIDAPASDAPNWRVTIEKVPPVERSYDPSLIDE